MASATKNLERINVDKLSSKPHPKSLQLDDIVTRCHGMAVRRGALERSEKRGSGFNLQPRFTDQSVFCEIECLAVNRSSRDERNRLSPTSPYLRGSAFPALALQRSNLS
jgi:hypothetical protein